MADRVILEGGKGNGWPRYQGRAVRWDDSGRPVAQVLRVFGWPQRSRVRWCNVCANVFVGDYAQWQCSDECRREYLRRVRRPYELQRAHERRKQREKVTNECYWCGRLIDAQRVTRRYCSASCRQLAYRQRLKLAS